MIRPAVVGGVMMMLGLGILGYSFVSLQTTVVREYGKDFRQYIDSLYYDSSCGYLWMCGVNPMIFYNFLYSGRDFLGWSFVRIPDVLEKENMIIENVVFRCSLCWIMNGSDDIIISVYALTKSQYQELRDIPQHPKRDEYDLLYTFRIGDLEYVGEGRSMFDPPMVHNFVLDIVVPKDKIIMFASDTRKDNVYYIESYWWDMNQKFSEWYQIIIQGKTYMKLYGYVYDEENKPLENVKVSGGTSWWVTDNTGYYELMLPEDTPTVVRFEKEGYESVTKFVTIFENTQMDVVMEKIPVPSKLTPMSYLGIGMTSLGMFVMVSDVVVEKRRKVGRAWRM